jgi:uncharacterized protein (TIGR03084 family)
VTASLFTQVVADLSDETAVLELVVRDLPQDAWLTPTPAVGWTVHDQITHLAYFDDATRSALVEPAAFVTARDALVAGGADFPDRIAAEHRHTTGAAAHRWWQESRAALLRVLRRTDPRARMPWFGPDMSATSAATARLMETWAHGRDVADALTRAHPATDRLRHVADLGVRTRGFAFANRGLPEPDGVVRVELTAPPGDLWTWGADEAPDRVAGPAEDFCLVVTQRRHVEDTALSVAGARAAEWMAIAQAFAGAAGAGRAPSGRS